MRRALLLALLGFVVTSTLSAQSVGRSSLGDGKTRYSVGPGRGHFSLSGYRYGRGGNRAAHAFFYANRWLDQGRIATQHLSNPDRSPGLNGGFFFHGGAAGYYGSRLGTPFAFGPSYGVGYELGYPGYWYGYYGPSPPSTWDWVDEWRDRQPQQEPETDEGSLLSRSVLLAVGMSDEEVMGILGTPIERIGLGVTEIWKYSSYSLFFENGELKEMR